MTDCGYPPELDEDLLADWCAFCDGHAEFGRYHFSSILMGMFHAGLTPEVEDYLRRFCHPFAPALFNNLLRIFGDQQTDREITRWIRSDLNHKTLLLGSEYRTERRNIEWLLAEEKWTFCDDRSSLSDIAMSSANFCALYEAESDYVCDLCGNNSRLSALNEALYHISTNFALAHAIIMPLLNSKIDLSNYFEVYLRGGDYVVADDSIVVFQFDCPTSA